MRRAASGEQKRQRRRANERAASGLSARLAIRDSSLCCGTMLSHLSTALVSPGLGQARLIATICPSIGFSSLVFFLKESR